MSAEHDALVEKLSMTEIIRLQDALSQALVRRFEKRLALAFSDVVGSTPYFAKFGDEAGRKLQQRHVDLVGRVITVEGGRIVDTAGDGAFLCFANLEGAVRAMIELQQQTAADNDGRQPEHRLAVRIGVHFGPVLTDGTLVSGDSVNLCSRIAGSASSGEIRLSRAALAELTDVRMRLKCRRLTAIPLKGIDHPVEMLSLDWHDHSIFPATVKINDGPEIPLPSQDLIRFGRLKEQGGLLANDILLQVMDPADSNRVSRWHFELHRRSKGYLLRSVSEALTEIDGVSLTKGQEAPVKVGSIVRVGGVLTLEFMGDPFLRMSESTIVPH